MDGNSISTGVVAAPTIIDPHDVPYFVTYPPEQYLHNEAFLTLSHYLESSEARDCFSSAAGVGEHLNSKLFKQTSISKNFSTYKSSCGLANLNSITHQNQNTINSRLAALISDRGTVICSGFLISTNTVITARHCINNSKYNKDKKYRLAINNIRKTITDKFSVSDSACNNYHNNNDHYLKNSIQPCDYIFLKVNHEIDLKVDNFPAAENLNPFDSLQVFGYNRINHAYEQTINSADSHWTNGLVIAKSPMCIVFNQQSIVFNSSRANCFSHGCQTVKGMSGAPIFKIDVTGAYFAGIQIGTTKLYDQDSWSASSTDRCNFSKDLVKLSSDAVNNIAIAAYQY